MPHSLTSAQKKKKAVAQAGKKASGLSKGPVATCGKAGSPGHKAQRWKDYQARGGTLTKAQWSKRYDTNMRNVTVGLQRERLYCSKLQGVSKTMKTPFTKRQIDIYRHKLRWMGQLKTGRISLTKQAIIDLQKDAWLASRGNRIEYILEKGCTQPFTNAVAAANKKLPAALAIVISGKKF